MSAQENCKSQRLAARLLSARVSVRVDGQHTLPGERTGVDWPRFWCSGQQRTRSPVVLHEPGQLGKSRIWTRASFLVTNGKEVFSFRYC